MNPIRIAFLLSAVVLVAQQPSRAFADKDEPKKDKPKFTISKETTYVTGPLDKDGYIDYAAALNKEMGKGITPQTNANLLLWKAFGPRPEGGNPMPAEYFKLLGMDPPPERGDYFIGFSRHLTENLKLKQDRIEVLMEQEHRGLRRGWNGKESAEFAEWLKMNEKPLAVVAEAISRPQYFNPYVPEKRDMNSAGLRGSLLPAVSTCRAVAKALAARALLRAREGKMEQGWQDLVTAHRLGRLISQGASPIELLEGIAIDDIACTADLAFLSESGLTAKQAQACLRDLHQLPSLSPLAEKLNLTHRCMLLESVLMLSRYGFEYLKVIDGLSGSGKPDPRLTAVLKTIDWDPALRSCNRWIDRVVKGVQLKEYATRTKLLNEIHHSMGLLRLTALDSSQQLVRNRDTAKLERELGKPLGDAVIGFFPKFFIKAQFALDRNEQTQRNLQVAFALAAFMADKGAYPKTLAELAPAYLPQVPGDLFSGKALIYRPNEKGFLLYSVGVNGIDEEGRSMDDDPVGDDLCIRIPLPKFKLSK